MHRNAFVVGLASFTLLLGACGDDQEERARTVDPPVSEASDDEPEDLDGEDVDDEPEPEPEPDPEGFGVEEALLTLDDMPTGWTQEPGEGPGGDEQATLCDVEPLDEVEALEEGSAEFSAGDFGPLLSHTVAAFERGGAEQSLERFFEALDDCEEWTEETEDGPMTFRPTALSFPSFGDETLAIRVDVESELVDMTMDMIAWRRDDVLSLILAIEVFGAPDAEQIEELVATADERLADL